MLTHEGFHSALLIDEMYQRSTFDFTLLHKAISERVDTADRLFDAVEKQLKKSPPHRVRLMMSNYFTPMFKRIKLLQLQPVHDPDDDIEKLEI